MEKLVKSEQLVKQKNQLNRKKSVKWKNWLNGKIS